MMKKTIKYSWLSVNALCLATSIASATPPQWDMIENGSQLSFTATQNGAPVSGEFKTFKATLLVDVNDLKSSSIAIIIDMNSISASYAELKSTLLTPDWFNVKLFPQAEFKASDFKKTGDNSYQANGTLTIRDKSAPVTLTFSAAFPETNIGVVTGSTVIKRSQFGVGQGEWASTAEIKDDVTVNFKVSAVKK